ncbi:hypothetical protein [Sediminibacillus massiliensis]|uniref:hypothetical protein n=1 Tax=Sediminibacillus massiliensis TaxID=1926277 RepID=UPI0009884AB3|nr:hypothetical protein [Sediminibacillus massiliensis]
MLIISRRAMAQEKMKSLMNGYSAYAESDELIRLVKKEIDKQNLSVVYDSSDAGCWFIPEIQTGDADNTGKISIMEKG